MSYILHFNFVQYHYFKKFNVEYFYNVNISGMHLFYTDVGFSTSVVCALLKRWNDRGSNHI